ncbi:MAG: T9SS C-terminal target domain-containing protein [Bacteroidetes bacterium]|nr:MAG: T9SS C-terminal target domain-containing protein [Bacteroidota bacterium]
MKKKLTIYLLFFAGIIFISLTPHTGDKNSSQAPIGRTGAPGESTCAGCHSGGSYTGEILFDLEDGEVTEYTPGETYTIVFTADYDAPRFGFSITALDADNQPAGDFTVLNDDNTSKAVAGNNRQYIGHKNANDNNVWEFEWTAPASDVGNVTFYYVINAANGDNSTGGDYVELGTTSIAPGDEPETFEVIFNVDMSSVAEYFNPDLDVVYITGDLLGWAEPGDEPELQTMTRIDNSFIFTRTLQLEEGEYQYKYFLNEGWSGGEWPADPNRVIAVMENMTINDVWGLMPGPDIFSLNLLINPEDAGTVTGEASFLANAIAQISATPAEGFVFINWTDEDDEIVSTEAEYQFNMPDSDLALTANFDAGNFVDETEELQVNVFPNPAQDHFTIRSDFLISHVTVTDLSGRVVLSQPVNLYETRIDNPLNTGVYIVSITTAEGVFVKKVQVR